MPEQLLDNLDRSPSAQQLGGVEVAELMNVQLHTGTRLAKVVSQSDLTGIVVGVTVSLSPRIFPTAVPESNAEVRTGDTIVAF